MAEQRKGAVVTVVVLAALLAGIGVWQFGDLGLRGGEEHESEDHSYGFSQGGWLESRAEEFWSAIKLVNQFTVCPHLIANYQCDRPEACG